MFQRIRLLASMRDYRVMRRAHCFSFEIPGFHPEKRELSEFDSGQRLSSALAKCRGTDALMPHQTRNIASITFRESADLADRKIERGQPPNIQYRGINAFERQRNRVLVRILMHQ